MDLPTYTNIWRIEKRLYKLYDFRLPMPLPISWIAVFCGITIPYVAILVAIGLPFNHNLLWLYVLPPGVLTWLTTRPVLENKRLPELLVSQLRYIGEPRTWCRLAPLSEKNEIRVYARVWHRAPAYAEEAEVLTAPAARAPALRGRGLPAAPEPRPGTGRGSGPARRIWQARPGRPDQVPQSAQAGPRVWPHAGIAPVRATGDAAGARGPRGLSVPVRAGSERAPLGRAAPAARHGTGRSAPGWTGPASSPGAAGAARPPRPAPVRTGSGAISPGRRLAIPGQVLRDPAPGGPAAAGPAPGGPAVARPAAADPAAGRPAAAVRAATGPAAAGPRPIAPPPIEVAHETQGPQGPAGVPLWGRPSSRRPAPGFQRSRFPGYPRSPCRSPQRPRSPCRSPQRPRSPCRSLQRRPLPVPRPPDAVPSRAEPAGASGRQPAPRCHPPPVRVSRAPWTRRRPRSAPHRPGPGTRGRLRHRSSAP